MTHGARYLELGSAALIALVGISGCDQSDDNASPPATIAPSPLPELRVPPPVRALRWMPGFMASAISEHRSRDAGERLEALHAPEDECRGAGTATFAVAADLTSAGGDETVLASVAQGVVVVDAHEHLLGAAPLADCGGSADEMVALAAGDAWIGEPVIVVVATVGGHRASETEVVLSTLGDERRLERIFSAVIEERDGDERREGAVVMVPGAIVQRSSDGAAHLFAFDAATRRFIEPGRD